MANSELTPQQIELLKQRLLSERQRIIDKGASHLADAAGLEARLVDEMDQASRDQEQSLLLQLADNERDLVFEIDAALARIEDGSYGTSEESGEPIGFPRLQVQPWARYSTVDQEQIERDDRMRRG
jgi:DnaK suppressor protein